MHKDECDWSGRQVLWGKPRVVRRDMKAMGIIIIIIIIIYFKNVNLSTLGLDAPLEMKPLHISLNTAHSGCKPSTFISSFTHSYQVFLPLPAHLTPTTTTTFLQADTQSSSLLCSTCPNHLNLPHLTTSSTPKDRTNPHIGGNDLSRTFVLRGIFLEFQPLLAQMPDIPCVFGGHLKR